MYQLGAGVISSMLPISNLQAPRYTDSLSPESPKAIAMWDFSWLLRRYRGGGFEHWDKVLDELVERGYNALRIDCFPQFIGLNDEAIVQEEYFLPKKNWHPSLWGNEFSVTIRPQESLINFLQKCRQRNISYVLASWFYGHGTNRNRSFSGSSGLVRSWNKVLELVRDNHLMDHLLYVDVLNEYPLWHGYHWLTSQLDQLNDTRNLATDFLNEEGQNRFNTDQILFYNTFLSTVIRELKSHWPNIRFTASQTNTLNTPWQHLDIKEMEVLDIHHWMIYNQPFSRYTGYFDHIHRMKNDTKFATTQQRISDYWNEHNEELSAWLEEGIRSRKDWARDKNIPLGNTEGWGAVMWMNHPALSWNFIKESAEQAVHLGVKYGYSFNCTSNFTHPHFELWQDIDWHREMTNIIRKI